jgi:hypothetical protein
MGCKIVFSPQFLTLALNLTFSPRRRKRHYTLVYYRQTVRPTQSQVFQRDGG